MGDVTRKIAIPVETRGIKPDGPGSPAPPAKPEGLGQGEAAGQPPKRE